MKEKLIDLLEKVYHFSVDHVTSDNQGVKLHCSVPGIHVSEDICGKIPSGCFVVDSTDSRRDDNRWTTQFRLNLILVMCTFEETLMEEVRKKQESTFDELVDQDWVG